MSQTSSSINPSIFRAYDIRGLVEKDLTTTTVELIGKGIGTFFRRQNLTRISVGRDARLSSESLKDALIAGLRSAGCDIIDIGLSTTPIVCRSVYLWDMDGGISVTGSHNPIDFNGLKIVSRDARPVAMDDIQEIRRIIETKSFVHGSGSLFQSNLTEEYFDTIRKVIRLDRSLKVAVDTGNGVVGPFVTPLLKSLGCEVVELYTELDGTFPHHLPNPETEANLQELMQIVKSTRSDIGLGFDGDGDRIGMVDDLGAYREADYIIILLARDYLGRHPGAKVLVDMKVSKNVINDIRQHGGQPVLWKTGYSLIKPKMIDDQILLGGELSGHMFVFEDYYPYDDALFAASRLLQFLSQQSQSVSELLAGLPKLFSTRLIEIPVPDTAKFGVVRQITSEYSQKYPVNDLDGARIDFKDGWAIVRASNTTPNLTLRFEANSQEALERMQHEVYGSLRKFSEVNIDGRVEH